MIPIYEALDFNGFAAGGTTRPWHVLVNENGQPQSYIAKFFSLKDIQQKNYILRELFGHFLAKEFDLPVPGAAFISMSAAFKQKLPDEAKNELKRKYTRIIFGSRHLGNGVLTYSPALHRRYLDETELETIYAFDQLIYNIDRNLRKPNMLYCDRKVFLIDHERSWAFDEPKAHFHPYSPVYKSHIFYKRLRKEAKNNPHIFETFAYYLQQINLNRFQPVIEYLTENEMDITEFYDWEVYIYEIKRNFANFIDSLKASLK